MGVVYLAREILYILRARAIKLVSMARIMYAFVYGFFPFLVCLRYESGTLSYQLFIDDGQAQSRMLIVLVLSVVAYSAFSLAYSTTKKSRKYTESYRSIEPGSLQLAGVLILVVGFLSLFLWTRAYGSVSGFIQHAGAIRSRRSPIYNPFAFLEHFTKVVQVAEYIFLALLIYQKGILNKVVNLLLLGLSTYGCIIFSLATDARGNVGLVAFSILLYILNVRLKAGQIGIKRALRQFGATLVMVFTLMVFSEGLLNYLRSGVFVSSNASRDFFGILEKEFGFIIRTQEVCIAETGMGGITPKLLDDLLNAALSWVPSRFIFFAVPAGLWDYNTQILMKWFGPFIGQAPTDIVSASLYLAGPIGYIVVPAVFGVIMKKVETRFCRRESDYYLDILYFSLMQHALSLVSHFSFEAPVLALFYLFLGNLIVQAVAFACRKRQARRHADVGASFA